MFSNPLMVNISNILAFGISKNFIALSLFGMLLMTVEHFIILKYASVISFINKRNFFLKWFLIYIEIGMIFIFGEVGQSEFIYFQF